jgi:hypothetical protein
MRPWPAERRPGPLCAGRRARRRITDRKALPLGEAMVIGLLREMSLGLQEDDAFFELARFDGRKIRIFNGRIGSVG